jgi:7-carboxy-7-deazaguanine synthase
MPVNTDSASVSAQEREDSTEGIPINEIFYSLQGEGKLAGMPTIFIRASGCNLRCWFCDSYHTSWEPTHAWMEIDEILENIREHERAEHVVLTGGEPLIHDESTDILEQVSDEGYHTTVETNGTIYRDAPIDLVSISPKLASSTPTAERDPKGNGEWAERHEQRRFNLDALIRLVENHPFQLKFVVTGRDDIAEINDLVTRVRTEASTQVRSQDVLLMPEGQTEAEIDKKREQVADLAMEHGYRYTPRLHVNLWNDEAGK